MSISSNIAFEESQQYALENEQELMLANEQQPTENEHKALELIKKLQNREVRLSFSWLKELAKSPRHFLNYKLKEWDLPNEGMIFGSIVDLLITEPNNFDLKFKIVKNFPSTEIQKGFVKDILSGNSIEVAFSNNYKKGKAEDVYNSLSDYIESLKNNITPITQNQYDEAKSCADYLLKQDKITTLLDSCSDFQSKIEFKYKGWDFIGFKDCSAKGLIIDLKHMSLLEPDYVDRQIMKMKYPLQMAIYQNGEEENIIADCYALAYDKSGNYIICKYDQSILAYARKELDYLLFKLEKCINENLWHESYNFHDHKGIKTLYKPNWVKGFEFE